jgi:hypothetical protein
VTVDETVSLCPPERFGQYFVRDTVECLVDVLVTPSAAGEFREHRSVQRPESKPTKRPDASQRSGIPVTSDVWQGHSSSGCWTLRRHGWMENHTSPGLAMTCPVTELA